MVLNGLDKCETCGSTNFERYNDGTQKCLECGKLFRDKKQSRDDDRVEEKKTKDQKKYTLDNKRPPPTPPLPSKKDGQTEKKDEVSVGNKSSDKDIEDHLDPKETILSSIEQKDIKLVATDGRVCQHTSKGRFLDLSYHDFSFLDIYQKNRYWISFIGIFLILSLILLNGLFRCQILSDLPIEPKFTFFVIGAILVIFGLVSDGNVVLIFKKDDGALSEWKIRLDSRVSKRSIYDFIKTVHHELKKRGD